MSTSQRQSTRRTFIKSVATTGAALPAVMPTLTRAASANGKVNIAGCGVQGKGASDIALTSKGNNVVAIC
ncbi:MAG: gfo/Idh/MocA family oxidoreductase, partial [Planctomycetota bacterium]